MHPDDVALVDLATGEPVAPHVASHVATCERCADEVTALREVVGLVGQPVPELVPVPPRVWDAVAARLDARAAAHAPAAPDAPGAPGAPDVTGATASEAPRAAAPDELSARREKRTRRRVAVGWVVGAAAAGLVVGGVGVRLLDGADPADSTVTVASTSLDALDTKRAMGTADVVRHDGRTDLDVHTGAMDPAGGYLEVWLINRDLERMVSVGVLEPGADTQSFAIPQELLDQGYVIVDISREGFDDQPGHSGQSLVRGTLAT